MIIRKATREDISGLARMLTGLFLIEKDFSADPGRQTTGLEMLIADEASSVVLVAEQDGSVTGMVTGQLVVSTASGGHSVLLEDMFVTEGHRRTGTGKKLIKALESWGKEIGALRIQLGADIHNMTALEFYAKNGFKESRMKMHYKSISG